MWEVIYISHFERWWVSLSDAQRRRVAVRVEALKRSGPALGRPTVDTIEGSRHSNMKELRAGTIRVLFAFDPRRRAVLLLGGDKRGQKRWYEKAIPLADGLYDQYLTTFDKEGGFDDRKEL